VHEQFFENPADKAKIYSYEIDIYLADKDITAAKKIFEVWLNEVQSGVTMAPTKQQSITYLKAFEG